jgi:hypothetical protein
MMAHTATMILRASMNSPSIIRRSLRRRRPLVVFNDQKDKKQQSINSTESAASKSSPIVFDWSQA